MNQVLICFLTAFSLFIVNLSAADNPNKSTLLNELHLNNQVVDTEGSVTIDQIKINYYAKS